MLRQKLAYDCRSPQRHAPEHVLWPGLPQEASGKGCDGDNGAMDPQFPGFGPWGAGRRELAAGQPFAGAKSRLGLEGRYCREEPSAQYTDWKDASSESH